MRRSALLFASLLGYQLVAQPIPEPIPGLPTITASSVTASLEANEGIVAWSARGDFLGISGQSGHENPFPLLVNVGEPLPLYLVDFGLPQNDMPDNLVIVDGKEYPVRTVGLGFVMPTTASGPIVPLVPATNPRLFSLAQRRSFLREWRLNSRPFVVFPSPRPNALPARRSPIS